MLYAIIAVLGIIIDQLIKYWTVSHIQVNVGLQTLIPKVLNITYVQNKGAAFSFMAGSSAGRIIFVVLCVVVCAVLIVLMAKGIISGAGARWCAVLVMSGAVGNAIDRVVSGYVVDMFEFAFFKFPVFNFADILITLGGIAFCLFILLEGRNEKAPVDREAKAAAKAARKAAKAAAAETEDENDKEEEAAPAPAAPVKAERPAKKAAAPFRQPAAPRAQVPAADPNDPFAEWERRMNGGAAPAAPAASAGTAAPVNDLHSDSTRVFRAVTEEPVKKAPVHIDENDAPAAAPAPAPAPQTAPAASGADEFDLDSILAEFGIGD